MSIRNKYLFPISLLFFLAFQLFLVNNRLYEIGILFYLVYTTFLFAINKNYVITFFVFYLPIAPMVSAFHKLFGILGPHEIIYGFACYVLFNIANARNIKLNKYQKLAIKFVYFVFFINIYIISKDIIMGLDPDRSKGVVYIFKNFVRYFLYYYSLVLLIKVIYTKGILNYIIEGIKYSVLVLVLSMLFTPELVKMGVEIFVSSAKQFKDTRFMGLYKAGGDFNSTGVFLVAVFGFFLALFEKTGGIINYIVFMGAAVLGILLTGSRTSFLALVSVILIFMIANKSGSAKFYILVAFIIFYLVFFQQLEIIILRFLDPSAVGAVDPESDGRVYKWIFYSNWIINNPETLLF